MTPAEERFKRAAAELVREGTYPGCVALCRKLRFNRERLDLSGREERWRAEALTAAGWIRRPNGSRSWAPPTP